MLVARVADLQPDLTQSCNIVINPFYRILGVPVLIMFQEYIDQLEIAVDIVALPYANDSLLELFVRLKDDGVLT